MNMFIALCLTLFVQDAPPTPDCIYDGYPPMMIQPCTKCINGEGMWFDHDAGDACEDEWFTCQANACENYQDTFRNVRLWYEAESRKITDEGIDCIRDASSDLEMDICMSIFNEKQNDLDDLWQDMQDELRQEYENTVAACDQGFFGCWLNCCKICEPDQGWVIDW